MVRGSPKRQVEPLAPMVRDPSLSTRDAEPPFDERPSPCIRRYFAVFPGMMYIPRGMSKEGSLKDLRSRCAPCGRTRVSPEPMET